MIDQFPTPVRVRLGNGMVQEVRGIKAAQDVLLDWPGNRRGRAYKAAVVAIMELGAPNIEAMEAAFRKAAKEAKILLQDGAGLA